jgi:hypothetical protein
MKSKFIKIMMISTVLSLIACSHTPKPSAVTTTQKYDFPEKVEMLLAKTENLGQYKMSVVKFTRP